MRLSDAASWDLNIDRYLNPFLPPPPWKYLPYPVSWWFGYRKTPPRGLGNILIAFWSCIGIFCGILAIEGVSRHVKLFQDHGAPVIIASFGAAAVLQFCAIESPLAQPRSAILGQLIAAVIGVGIAKLFALNPDAENLRWVAGALACAVTTVAMLLTKTIHPPAGSTALLAAVDADTLELGWLLVPIMMLGCALMLGVALIVNNIQRRFPSFWWTPEDLSRPKPADIETTESKYEPSLGSSTTETHEVQLIIRRGQVIAPEGFYLTDEERQYLESLGNRI
ncbi:HPP family protein [Paecilomyces variotii No. 5]|uniref:HPP family protein n=1 Tax=Byssochlamys spectabilis (strain No. 5 / NBRC 109023) TaxID=1356009 RepID=V5HRD6_BYSSN|nr:HPP family protein [Paecilomyces variotii No. 5]